jgi:hypothetical protein
MTVLQNVVDKHLTVCEVVPNIMIMKWICLRTKERRPEAYPNWPSGLTPQNLRGWDSSADEYAVKVSHVRARTRAFVWTLIRHVDEWTDVVLQFLAYLHFTILSRCGVDWSCRDARRNNTRCSYQNFGLDLRTQFRPGSNPTQKFVMKGRNSSVDPCVRTSKSWCWRWCKLSFQQTLIQRRFHSIIHIQTRGRRRGTLTAWRPCRCLSFVNFRNFVMLIPKCWQQARQLHMLRMVMLISMKQSVPSW